MPGGRPPEGVERKVESSRTIFRVPEEQRPYGDTYTHMIVRWETTDWRGESHPRFKVDDLTAADAEKWQKKALRALGWSNRLRQEDRDTSSMEGAFRSYILVHPVTVDGEVAITGVMPSCE